MKKGKSKKVLMTALAFAVGASAPMATKASQDGLFNLKEVGSQPVLIAEGKCGGKMKGAEGKCGPKKMMKKIFKKDKKSTTTKAKSGEAKCGEGMCGAGKEKKQ